uniref:(northern house mosquito) hypothetical protein n=1 Tax=Culex pipiens TaxID=7175 RepID=A0A8D8GTX0_CULPI
MDYSIILFSSSKSRLRKFDMLVQSFNLVPATNPSGFQISPKFLVFCFLQTISLSFLCTAKRQEIFLQRIVRIFPPGGCCCCIFPLRKSGNNFGFSFGLGAKIFRLKFWCSFGSS